MTASARQWVTIVAACAAVSLILHMGMYTNQTQQHGGVTHLAYRGAVNESAPQWAAHLGDSIARANHDITKLGERLSTVAADIRHVHTKTNKLANKTDNHDAYATIISKHDELAKQLTALTQRLDTFQPRVDAGVSKSEAIDADVKQLQQTVTSLATAITTAGTDATNQHAALTAEITKLSSALTTLQAAVAAGKNGAAAAPPAGTHPLHNWKLHDVETHAEKVALIIESRPIHRLIRTIKQFMSVMKDDWEFQVWFSTQNEKMLRDSPEIQAAMRLGRLKMYPMGRDVFDIPWYNQLMMHNVSFWEFVGAKHMLIFQVDAVLCPNSPKKIEDFLDYDYCGAPWASPWYGDAGGNGGLSLRGRDATLRCARDWRGYGANEDGYFTECVAHAEERKERRICRREVAKTFSVETIYYPTPWGVHNAWQYLKPEETVALQQWCPEMADARLAHSPTVDWSATVGGAPSH